MVLNTTFYNISVIKWRSVLLVEEAGIPNENHRSYKFYLVFLTKVRLRVCVALFFVSWVWPFCTDDFVRSYVVFCDFDGCLVSTRDSSDRTTVFYFWFSVELVFPCYFIVFQLIHLRLSVYDLPSVQVTARTCRCVYCVSEMSKSNQYFFSS
jgi:hypothetical protein